MSLDLEKEKVAVGVIHPGFMRTDMTKGVGFDEFWDEGHGGLLFMTCCCFFVY